MPSGVSSLIGGLQGGQQQTNPYAGAPGLNQMQAANILQQLRGGPAGGMMGAAPSPQAAQQALLAQALGGGIKTNNQPANAYTGGMMTGGPAMQGYMQSLGLGAPQSTMQGFNGFAPMQPNAYAQGPQQAALQGMARGLGGRSPMQPGAYATNPQTNNAYSQGLQSWGSIPFAGMF